MFAQFMSYYNWLCTWTISTVRRVPREGYNSAVLLNAMWTKTCPHAFSIMPCQHASTGGIKIWCSFAAFLCLFWTLRWTTWNVDIFVIFWVFSGYNLDQSPLCFYNVIWFQSPIFPLCCWASFLLSLRRVGITSYCLSECDSLHPEIHKYISMYIYMLNHN